MIRLNDDVPVDCPGSVLAREPDCRSAVPDSYQRCSCRCRPRPISRIPAISLYQLSAVTTRSIAHTSEGQTEAYTSACLRILSKRQQRASPKVQKQNRLSVGISSSWEVFSTRNRRHWDLIKFKHRLVINSWNTVSSKKHPVSAQTELKLKDWSIWFQVEGCDPTIQLWWTQLHGLAHNTLWNQIEGWNPQTVAFCWCTILRLRLKPSLIG